MRASSTGLGLIAIVSLFACSTNAVSESPSTHANNGNGDGTGTAGSSTGSETDLSDAPSLIAPNLEVTGVAILQAVQVNVVKNGRLVSQAKRNAPIVAKRPGLIRVYVTPGADWKPSAVTAEVRLVAGDTKLPILRETKTINGTSKDDDPKSTFNLEVPGDALPSGVTFQVALTTSDGVAVPAGEESPGRFPGDGSFQDLGTEVSGKLKVVVVPVKYDADGSGRTPDIGATQLERYKQTLMQRYPTSEVEVTTHSPYPWTTKISGNGSGFSSVLRAMHQLRQKDKVGDDVYYYGLLAPTTSMSSFCQGGCVAGLSTVADADTPVLRASVGIGFVGQESANTMAHEVGHAHGREHAPCGGAAGVDPDYPYPQAQLGVWGYDMFSKTLISPTKGRDMMGYCPNEWVSDYTYKALFERIVAVNTEKNVLHVMPNGGSSHTQATRYRIASVGAAGDLTWDGDAEIDVDDELAAGTAVWARYRAESGAEITSRRARFVRFDHLPGGLLFVPHEAALPWRSLHVDGYKEAFVR